MPKGFTLVEVMVSVAIVGIGVVGVLQGLGAMTNSQIRAQELERMQRLAVHKYEELIATGELQGASLGGDFSDWNLPDYTWEAEVSDVGIENLDSIRVTVGKEGSNLDASVEGLQYTAPEQSETGGGTTQPGGGG